MFKSMINFELISVKDKGMCLNLFFFMWTPSFSINYGKDSFVSFVLPLLNDQLIIFT